MAGEKRTQDQEETLLSETVVLVDIEGTTTSISFVKDTLFPYVRENLKKYVETKWEDEEFKKDLEKLKEQAKKDEEDKVEGFVSITGANAEEEKESLVKNVLWQMDGDRKTGALKQLQGHIWREAYESGAVKGHVYEDVPKALESWTNDGRKVYVYSSGSVEAQKLLFGHSVCGDLLKHFSGYFDTEVGPKQEANSYKNILSKIGVEASTVIFLTDVVKEAAAAKEAGLSSVIVLREGNAALTDEERVTFTTIKSFLDLTFQTSTKRQKLETTETQETAIKSTTDVSEPMDTSEDVEMSDVSEKKAEKVQTKEVVKSETTENAKKQLQEDVQTPSEKAEEPMVTDAKDVPIAEKVTESEAAEKSDSQSKLLEVSKKLDSDENVQPVVTDNTEAKLTLSESNTDKTADKTSEKLDKPAETPEKIAEPTPVEATPPTTNPPDVGTCEPKSKSEPAPTTEKSTDESIADTPTDAKPEVTAATDTKVVEDGIKEKNINNSTESKAEEECAKADKDEAKEQSVNTAVPNSSVVERKKSECEETSIKTSEESTKAEETPAADVTENGDVPQENVEKATAPTITESEATSSKTDTNAEAKDTTETTAETKSETELKTADEKSPKAKDAEETAATVNDTEKHETSVETTKQESKEESVKEETVVDEVKDKNTVDPENKKLNGTTQNGDTDVAVSDDKLHRNGLNEGSSNDKLNSTASENASAQNGEPESSSEASAESIKVKKVVDSTIADGAGEPDVVPPVVVAATS